MPCGSPYFNSIKVQFELGIWDRMIKAYENFNSIKVQFEPDDFR